VNLARVVSTNKKLCVKCIIIATDRAGARLEERLIDRVFTARRRVTTTTRATTTIRERTRDRHVELYKDDAGDDDTGGDARKGGFDDDDDEDASKNPNE